MHALSRNASIAAAALVLAACAAAPTGPSVMTLPGRSKSFAQFQSDDRDCRGFAATQIGVGSSDAPADAAVTRAAIGTGVGAAAGTLIGVGASNAGAGAAIGAGSGLLLGSAAGASAGDSSARGLQRRYDVAYIQCMYANGNQVPVFGRVAPEQRGPFVGPPPPPGPG
ncbi:MAG: hypothetical protein ACRDMZ_10065 [Solirubrobacteraceae bacterium]